MTWGELGWTLEDNAAVNTGIRMMGAKKYKTYRVYTKDLATELTGCPAADLPLQRAGVDLPGESGRSGRQ